VENIPELKVKSCLPPDNHFKLPFYLRVNNLGLLEVLPRKKKRLAHYNCWIEIEYCAYDREVEIKEAATFLDERKGLHLTNYDRLTELRVQRCLAGWNLHEIPDLTVPLHRINGLLTDESLNGWKKLPPPLRKYISNQVNEAIGG